MVAPIFPVSICYPRCSFSSAACRKMVRTPRAASVGSSQRRRLPGLCASLRTTPFEAGMALFSFNYNSAVGKLVIKHKDAAGIHICSKTCGSWCKVPSGHAQMLTNTRSGGGRCSLPFSVFKRDWLMNHQCGCLQSARCSCSGRLR